jgi:hypothetical protein
MEPASKRPRKPAPPPLCFADVFAMTRVNAKGVARSRPLPLGFRGFDAKPPQMIVYGSDHVATRYDAALRPRRDGRCVASALLPDGAGVLLARVVDAQPQLYLVDRDVALPLADPPREVALELGPARGAVERDFPRAPALAMAPAPIARRSPAPASTAAGGRSPPSSRPARRATASGDRRRTRPRRRAPIAGASAPDRSDTPSR